MNAVRGAVVVADALVAAPEAGHICVAIDVTGPEPLPEGHPLWKAPNLQLTPHVAGSTPKFNGAHHAVRRRPVDRYMKGEPLQNVVTGEY